MAFSQDGPLPGLATTQSSRKQEIDSSLSQVGPLPG